MALHPLCTHQTTVKSEGESGLAFPIRCKRWSCETCAQLNRARVIAIARNSKPRALLTLTVSSKDYPDPDDAAQALKRGLRLLRLRLSRHPRLTNFQFLAVFERHKSGHPHLHLLIKGNYLPWKELRAIWQSLTGSYMVDIRKIASTGHAALYCAKYIGKDLAAFAGCKRWWRSHGYSDTPTDDYVPEHRPRQFERWTFTIHELRFALAAQGFAIEKEGREGIRWRPRDGEERPPPAEWAMRAVGARSALFGHKK